MRLRPSRRRFLRLAAAGSSALALAAMSRAQARKSPSSTNIPSRRRPGDRYRVVDLKPGKPGGAYGWW